MIKSPFDLTIDYAELALDSFLDNEAIKQIPIVKTFVGLVKGGVKVHEIFFAKKLLTFLQEFHSGNIEPEKVEHFRNNLKYRNEAVENLTIMIGRFVDVQKAKHNPTSRENPRSLSVVLLVRR
ncbi:MAG: hypothetical protein JWP44_925 [Mucilaginibacter sp.]|nr:hypothetical protein [Mucilaginibacter sp.]